MTRVLRAGGPAVSGPANVRPSAATLRRIDDYLAKRAKFSGTVLIAQDGEVVFAKGYGQANRATKAANGPDTLFDVGSVSKQFVAAAILKLEAQGKLRTSDRLSRYFDVTGAKANITLAQLLSHRSGLDEPAGDARVSPSDGKRFLEDALRRMPLRAAPGRSFLYNNANYSLLAQVIEQASGQRFEDYLTQHLFRPAGMTRTGFQARGSFDSAKAAQGYLGRELVGRAGSLPYDWAYRGAMGVVSSAADLHAWTKALRGEAVLPRAARERLFTPTGPTDEPGASYGLGWYVHRDRGSHVAWHEGNTQGYAANVSLDLKRGLTTIVLTNDYEHSRFVGDVDVLLRGGEPRGIHQPPTRPNGP